VRTLLLALLPVLAGCDDIFGTRDAHQPGAQLGTFHVVGTRVSNTCGEGALGTTPTWEFDVDLARDDGVLYWDNGAEVVSCALADDDKTFSVETLIVVNMRSEETTGYGPCSVRRRDVASGALSDAGEDVKKFTATLAYDFAPTEGSQCWDLVEGEQPIFAALPCAMTYTLSATRTAAPPPPSP